MAEWICDNCDKPLPKNFVTVQGYKVKLCSKKCAGELFLILESHTKKSWLKQNPSERKNYESTTKDTPTTTNKV